MVIEDSSDLEKPHDLKNDDRDICILFINGVFEPTHLKGKEESSSYQLSLAMIRGLCIYTNKYKFFINERAKLTHCMPLEFLDLNPLRLRCPIHDKGYSIKIKRSNVIQACNL